MSNTIIDYNDLVDVIDILKNPVKTYLTDENIFFKVYYSNQKHTKIFTVNLDRAVEYIISMKIMKDQDNELIDNLLKNGYPGLYEMSIKKLAKIFKEVYMEKGEKFNDESYSVELIIKNYCIRLC